MYKLLSLVRDFYWGVIIVTNLEIIGVFGVTFSSIRIPWKAASSMRLLQGFANLPGQGRSNCFFGKGDLGAGSGLVS